MSSVLICPHDPSFVWDLNDETTYEVTAAITSIALPATVVLNLLFIVAVRRSRQLQTNSTFLLASLAFADLLVGLVSMPLTIAFDILLLHQVFLDNVCKIDYVHGIFLYSACCSSLYHLTVMAWERNVAVTRPMEYKVVVTRSYLKKSVALAWLAVALTISPCYILEAIDVDYKYIEIALIICVLPAVVCVILIVYLYGSIYRAVRRKKDDQISQVSDLIRAKLEAKLAKTTGMLTLALIVSFVPSIIFLSVGTVWPLLHNSKFFLWGQMMTHLNSLINPILYVYRNRRFRNAILEMLSIKNPQGAKALEDGVIPNNRRKNPSASPDVSQLQIPQKRIRSSSLDPAMKIIRETGRGRSVSTAAMCTDNGLVSDFSLQLTPLNKVVVTCTVHVERKPAGKRTRDGGSKHASELDSAQPARKTNIKKAKSLGDIEFVELFNCHREYLKKQIERPKTGPSSFSRNVISHVFSLEDVHGK